MRVFGRVLCIRHTTTQRRSGPNCNLPSVSIPTSAPLPHTANPSYRLGEDQNQLCLITDSNGHRGGRRLRKRKKDVKGREVRVKSSFHYRRGVKIMTSGNYLYEKQSLPYKNNQQAKLRGPSDGVCVCVYDAVKGQPINLKR